MKFLLVGYFFHGYIERLASKLVAQGYEVEYIPHGQIFDYIPKRYRRLVYLIYKLFDKVYLPFGFNNKKYAIFTLLFGRFFYLYLKKNIGNKSYQATIFIGTRELSSFTVKKLLSLSQLGKLALYKWDSESRFSLKSIHKYFDLVLSFQRSDSGGLVTYLPNFHFVENKGFFAKDIDVVAVSIYSESRYQKFEEFLRKIDCESNVFGYFVNKSLKEKKKYVYGDTIPHEEVLRLYQRARVVLDFCPPQQEGMSQRVIEALASNCIVVTDNHDALANFKCSGRVLGYYDHFKLSATNESISELDFIRQCFYTNWFLLIVDKLKIT